jgi:hypothetical protein
MPSTAARRFDALAIKRMSDRPQRGCPSDPNGTQDRRDLLSKGRCPFDQNGPPQQARFSQNVRIAQGYPVGFLAASAALVRSAMRRRSFSAKAAYRCSINGSASRPSSATMKGTRCAIRPATKATSRESRSSLATTTLHFAVFAAAKAAG